MNYSSPGSLALNKAVCYMSYPPRHFVVVSNWKKQKEHMHSEALQEKECCYNLIEIDKMRT